MLEHLLPKGKLVVADLLSPVVRRTLAEILIIVVAAGRGDGTTRLVAGLAADPRDIGKAEGTVVEPVVAHPAVDHRTFGRRDLQRRVRVEQRHDDGDALVGRSDHPDAAVRFWTVIDRKST